ncbi:mechanosensitive ion channel domain-containing protein [Flavobacterium coralii]|uniref:mechanosensitive ion channel family protein n=1 Tax=Flavobacterium coralii TaxID=2838017 RepID=UPI000C4C45E3|nr:mechanosensitive ion channel protein MscS [Flavobacterium sp.]|tara:strand:- start:75201 stop:76043 length:843 start_codon:yes stop_codon:yes gene_type:complete
MNDFNDALERLSESLVDFFPNLLKALVILIIGIFAIKFFRWFMKRIMTRRQDMDPTLIKFMMDLLTWVLRIFLFIMVVNALGVETSAFVAVIGAAGLAIGLSLQGSLSNFAGGILIILFKPFRVGDFIEVQGEGGTVTEIQILYTRMLTPNNQVVYIPNGALSNGNIKNYSKEPIRKAELIIGVAYNSDIKHVKSVLARIIEMDKTILADPAPVIRIKDLADSSVNFQVFVWATNADFWQMLSDFKENTKIEFDKEGIEIPFPQRDINVRALPDKDNSVL